MVPADATVHDFLPLCHQFMQRRFFQFDPDMQHGKLLEFNPLGKMKPRRFNAEWQGFWRAIMTNTNGRLYSAIHCTGWPRAVVDIL